MLRDLLNFIDGLFGVQSKSVASIRCVSILGILLTPLAIALMWPKQIETVLHWIRKSLVRFSIVVIIALVPSALFWRWLVLPIANIWGSKLDCSEAAIEEITTAIFWMISGIYIVLVCGFWCIWQHYMSNNHFNMRKVKNMLSHDSAICLWRHDFLGREPIVNAAVDAILRANVSREAEYIGIYGAWGSGKTSVMNLVRREMTRKGEDGAFPAIFVDFQTWSFANSTDAIAGFLRSVIHTLQRYGEVKTAEAFKSLAQMHSLRRINLRGGLAGDILETVRQWFFATVYNEKRTLQRVRIALRAMKPRLVVVIDDLERISVHDVGTIISFLKANFNLPNTVIVFLSDRNHLARSIALYLGGNTKGQGVEELGCQYLEKIITHSIELPCFEEQQVWRHVIAELKKLFPVDECSDYNIDTDDGDDYETVKKYIKTTRDAKRFLSKVWTGIAVHKNATRTSTLNIHIGDFLALTAIKIWEPNVYLNLKGLIEDLIKRWKDHILSYDWGMTQSEYDQWIARNVPDEFRRAVVQTFLEKRAGVVKEQRNSNDLYVLKGIGDVETRLSFRLASPSCYRMYFEDFSDFHYVPKHVLTDFITSISAHVVPTAILGKLRKDGRLQEFVRTIEGVKEFKDADATVTYFKSLLWLSNQSYDETYFGWQHGDLDYNGPYLYDIYIAIGRCVLRYMRKWDGGRYANRLLLGNSQKSADTASAGSLLLKACKSVPSCFLIWQFLSWDQDHQGVANLQYAGQLFDHSDYEEFVDLYLDNIEILQREDKVFTSQVFFDLMRGWNISLIRRNDRDRYRRMRCAIFPSLSIIENVIKLKPFYERSVVKYGDGVVINGKTFLGVDVTFCRRFFGMILLRKIQKTLSAHLDLPDEIQMLACAFRFAVEHNMDDKVCNFDTQVNHVKKMFEKNVSDHSV